jgi:hypothetical protein
VDSGIWFSPKSIGHVIHVGGVVAKSGALTHVPKSLFTKEICDFLATLTATNPGSGNMTGFR